MYIFIIYVTPLFYIGQIHRIYFAIKNQRRFGKLRKGWIGFNTVLMLASLGFSFRCLWPYHCGSDSEVGFAMIFAGLAQTIVATLIILEFMTWMLLKDD